MEDEKLPNSLQEVQTKKSISLIRSLFPLPLLSRGAVGMGFIAGVGVAEFHKPRSQLSTKGLC